MKFKVGDRYLCKLYYFEAYEIGKHYTIVKIDKSSVLFEDNIGTFWFYCDPNNYNEYRIPYVWDYFYSKQEERKLKLEKLERKT